MSVYLPVISSASDAKYLRKQTEGVLTGDDGSALKNRIRSLDRSVKRAGMWATFGAEVEFQFSINPEQLETAEKRGIGDEEDLLDARHRLYWAVVNGVNPYQGVTHAVYKGEVVDPSDTGMCALESGHVQFTNTDGQDDSIIEVQTAPGSAPRAIERYWRVISAIGKTAETNGLMAIINSTHLSTALLANDPVYNEWRILGNQEHDASAYIAAVQRNLVLLQPFQLDAGVEQGQVILEAFPTNKSCSTTVHRERLEMRHPVIGIADPRVDALAVLNGVKDVQSGEVHQSVLRTASQTQSIKGLYTYENNDAVSASNVLRAVSGIDTSDSSLVTVSDVDRSAHATCLTNHLDTFVTRATKTSDTPITSAYADGAAVQKILTGIKVTDEGVVVSDTNPYAMSLRQIFSGTRVNKGIRLHRVEPTLIFDSPDLHLERRRHIKKSSRIRAMFGKATSSVVGAEESVVRRQTLIDSQMVVLDTDTSE